ncbi:ATP-binding protein [Teichococcus rhizosphaerae]|uniref:ATP-binding protein n=1 Tax=Teichococcus rhizosphaerae TaxID=1335062 RepID=UPI00159BC4C8|nr:ATP-binding protein [Pseudoroseomonas rhizosphaerae]
MSSTVTRLRVQDEDFLVAAMIERCPKTMMIRELFKNALEAAATAPEGQRRVEFSALPVNGVPKLALWNSGQGLTGPELYRMCDIAASIRKENALDRNFGMGAKVASLPSNQGGMRYRSAHEGAVQEVMIGKFDGIYGRLLRPGPGGIPAEVIAVTEAARAEGRDPAADWTEVVLFGNKPDQNTVIDPYGGNPRSARNWLVEAVRSRFFRFPEEVEIVFRAGVAYLKEDRRLVSLASRLAALQQYEAVRTPEGITIHYAYNPALLEPGAGSGAEAWNTGESMGALVYQDEIYSILRGAAWLKEAPSFGLPFLARAVTVLVELPNDYSVLPEAYREFLRYRSERQEQVRVHDFAALAVRHQPDWLKRLLAEAVPRADYIDDILAEMREMLEKLGVALRRPNEAPNFRPKALAPNPPQETGEPMPFRAEKPPAIILLRDPTDIAGRGLAHRAAAYYAETHQLHINLQYAVIGETAQLLAAGAPAEYDIEGVQAAAQLVAERAMVGRVARALTHALAKRGRPREWAEGSLRLVFSPEALTLAADDTQTGRHDTEASFAEALRRVPKAATPEPGPEEPPAPSEAEAAPTEGATAPEAVVENASPAVAHAEPAKQPQASGRALPLRLGVLLFSALRRMIPSVARRQH